MRVRVLFWLLFAIAAVQVHALDTENIAYWEEWSAGEWTSTNWFDWDRVPLPAPGFPDTNHLAIISGGEVAISSQSVSVAGLHVVGGSVLYVSNGCSLTVHSGFQNNPDSYSPKYVISHGVVNVWNSNSAPVYDVVFNLGSDESEGFLDFGATWGATNDFRGNFGTLHGVVVNVRKGGLRVDAHSISMREGCRVTTLGQEVVFRGDWLNPDETTTFAVNGDGPGEIVVGGDWSFGGCTLEVVFDVNGVSLIQVGGNAILTNSTLKIGASGVLTNTAASYDLVRVPSANSIQTNGLAVVAADVGGLACAISIDENRNGYDYLVLTPEGFWPTVEITDPPDETLVESGTNVVIQATASDRDGTVTKVEFFANTNKLGEVVSPPYSFVWTNVPGGVYELKVAATDNDSHRAESEGILLNVEGRTSNGRNVFSTGGATIIFDDGCVQE